MSAHTVVRQPGLAGHLRSRTTAAAAAAVPPSPSTAVSRGLLGQEGLMAQGSGVHLTGASMRFLEMGMAGAAIATALLLGVGR